MARDITAGFQTEIESSSLLPILLFKAEFDGGHTRFWTGIGDLTFDSEIYTGSGDLIRIERVDETQDLVSNSVRVQLSGVPSSIVSIALAEPYQGRPITLWFGVIDRSTGALIADPYQIFKGKMDVMTLEDSGSEAKILLDSESDLIAFRQSRETRYTPEDQKVIYPADRGLDFVPLIQDIELTWGAGR